MLKNPRVGMVVVINSFGIYQANGVDKNCPIRPDVMTVTEVGDYWIETEVGPVKDVDVDHPYWSQFLLDSSCFDEVGDKTTYLEE